MINKKIALFMLPLLTEGGGAEKYFINLAHTINTYFSRVDIITLDKSDFKKLARLFYLSHFDFDAVSIVGREKEDIIHTFLGKSNWIKVPFKSLKTVLNCYDLIYSKNEIIDLITLKIIGFDRLPPVIVGIHTPLKYEKSTTVLSLIHNFLYNGIFYRWLLSNSKGIHASNKATLHSLDKSIRKKTFLIPYPFSVDEVLETKKKYHYQHLRHKGRFKIIFAGRLSEQKGIDKLELICKSLTHFNKHEIEFNIFGTGDKENTAVVLALVKKYPFVSYYGHVENRFMPHILSKHDLLVAPSKWETMPYIILEAQSLGLPVLSYNIPGSSDIIRNKKTGLLAQSDYELTKFTNEAISGKYKFNPVTTSSMIRKKFDQQIIYDKMVKLFRSTLYEKA